MNDMDTIEYLQRAIEYAPKNPGTINAPGLSGWTTPAGHVLCVICASRIIARGCHLPRDSEPIWDKDVICCLGCESRSP